MKNVKPAPVSDYSNEEIKFIKRDDTSSIENLGGSQIFDIKIKNDAESSYYNTPEP